MAPAASAAARAFSASRGTRRGHSGYGAFAAWTTTSVPRAASTTDSLERRSRWTTSVPVGNPPVPDDGRTTARTWWPARRARRTTAPPMDPLAPRTTIRTPPRDAQSIDKADATRGEVAYVHDACTRPGYPREPRWAIRTRLGEAGEVRTMGRNGIKLGPRATIFVVVLLAASAVGILTPTLSNTVSKDVQVNGFAVTLTVDGVPDSVAPGDIFRVTAAMANNANRPVPAVLRMEVRNPNTTTPSELTVYAGCGAEEVVSGTRLIYYIGWHGPLLAPKGVSFAAGSTAAVVDASIGTADYWPSVLHEIQDRDPAGYVSLVNPCRTAPGWGGNSDSAFLKVLAS